MASNTSKYNWLQGARVAVSKRKKSTDSRGLDLKRNYASFWMDDDDDKRFGTIIDNQKTDMVRLVKLTAYRKAVTNFVKIMTKQEIPVLWYGDSSHTDGKSITLSTGIKDKNFDVTVGLALHEASHVVLTDFDLIKALYLPASAVPGELLHKCLGMRKILDNTVERGHKMGHHVEALLKGMHNWVEDRRIDYFVFSTSPGYKAYYHKLYDEYWNSKEVLKGMLSTEYRKPTLDSYEFHIYNMINPIFDRKALPGLDRIVAEIDLANISRLTSSEDTFLVANRVVNIILDNIEAAEQKQQQSSGNKQSDPNRQQGGSNSSSAHSQDQNDQLQQDGDGNKEQDTEQDGDGNKEQQLDSSAGASNAAYNALHEQRKFLSGSSDKKRATNKLQKQLQQVATLSVELETAMFDNKPVTVLMVDYTNEYNVGRFLELNDDTNHDSKQRLANRIALTANHYFGVNRDDFYPYPHQSTYVQKGLEMGGLLGRKLQVHSESRTTVTNRLRSGKIDNRRLAHAGYGIESVFNQIAVDQCKPAHVHITLDGSGSMYGRKWQNAVMMTVAIGKAITYSQNLDLQVSIRSTISDSTPTNILIYDSKKNNLTHLTRVLTYFNSNGVTPEGLCFEGMLKKGMLKASDSTVDSYLINISDGEPQGCGSYYGDTAFYHTRAMVNKMRSDLNMTVLSYFVEEPPYGEEEVTYKPSNNFVTMYGSSAVAIPADSVMQIAKTMNKMFLGSKI